MKTLEFNAALKNLSNNKNMLCKDKIAKAPNELKNQIINFLVRNRQAIIKDLINLETDQSWLSSCGYLYHFSNAHFNFLATCEQKASHESREEKKRNTLTEEDRKTALKWYANDNFDLITIAQHFKISVEALKSNLRTTI
jgi:hypothetical protein